MDRVQDELDDEDLHKFLREGHKLMGQINRLYRKLDPNSTEYLRYEKILIWMIGAYFKIENFRSEIYLGILEKQILSETGDKSFKD